MIAKTGKETEKLQWGKSREVRDSSYSQVCGISLPAISHHLNTISKEERHTAIHIFRVTL